ncbi:hypothetical protein E1B28_003073 [Marasmius oreades]|uniref:Tyr recombinase domain-containing protein n=1 Tax=Marasmius oreades TaxID=181124 RepID=A0A9P7RMA1_9AGAR|nr:uncharacterized protein E1B28_003073 [Marasmius oreades]KAG7085513.1 hypothetical protein E1B28_003073 [Marasmius oreades]
MSPNASHLILQYKGLQLVTSDYQTRNQDFMMEVEDDMECEQETLGLKNKGDGGLGENDMAEDQEDKNKDDGNEDEEMSNGDNDNTTDETTVTAKSKDHANWKLKPEVKALLKSASKGVSEGTDAAYRSLMKQCTKFVKENQWIGDNEDFFRPEPHPELPEMIVSWILSDCDSYNLDGSVKPPNEERSTYAHAQKMRAAATFGFGHIHGLETGLGSAAQAGETPTSARAVTADLMGRLYNFNVRPENRAIKQYAPGKRVKDDMDAETWAGGRFRRLLHCAYTVAFACLLQVDEVLKIQTHDVEKFEKDGEVILKLTLPFRKTDQFGDIQPFYLRELPEEMRHLCPVRAWADWLAASEIEDGYIFRRIDKSDRVVGGQNKPMTSAQFLEGFRNNLLDIGVDPAPYGTHSFRCGGCQWLSVDLRWPIRKILSHFMER